MKTKTMIGTSALPALLVAAGLLGGCATEPVGEYTARQYYYESGPGGERVRVVRRFSGAGASDISAARGYRTYRRSLEPVGERFYPQTRPIGRGYDSATGSWAPAITPYSGNSPVSPSQWY